MHKWHISFKQQIFVAVCHQIRRTIHKLQSQAHWLHCRMFFLLFCLSSKQEDTNTDCEDMETLEKRNNQKVKIGELLKQICYFFSFICYYCKCIEYLLLFSEYE